MKIGLDFDGVISDCGKLKVNGAKRLYGIDIPHAKFKKEIVIGEKHLTAGQYRELQKTIYGTREFGLSMDPVDGMLQYLPLLVSEDHDIRIVTSRGEMEMEIAKEWSIGLGLKLNFTSVGNKSKAQAVHGLDLYVDDDLDKLEPLVEIVPNLFMFSWGYNDHIDIGSVAKRVASWEELYRTIHTLENGR
ncbi:MAG: hypothetical protein Q8P17_00295 [bacterium]|nr:hypothetical protein [bacterium]